MTFSEHCSSSIKRGSSQCVVQTYDLINICFCFSTTNIITIVSPTGIFTYYVRHFLAFQTAIVIYSHLRATCFSSEKIFYGNVFSQAGTFTFKYCRGGNDWILGSLMRCCSQLSIWMKSLLKEPISSFLYLVGADPAAKLQPEQLLFKFLYNPVSF